MPNGSNSAAMMASGRTKRGQHSQSIEPSRPTKIADLQSPNLLGSERAKWSTGNAHKSQGERECRRKPGTAGRRRASRRRPNRPARMSLRRSARESTAIHRRRSVIGIGAVWRRSDAREQWSISAKLHSRGWLRGGSGELSISCWWLDSAIAHRYYWAGFGLTRPIRSAFNSSQASTSSRPLPSSRRSRRQRRRERPGYHGSHAQMQ
jgi:hypothetical protein